MSSYFGAGKWTMDGNILVLKDDEEIGYPIVNNFQVIDGALIFISDKSTNFLYVQVADGDKFVED